MEYSELYQKAQNDLQLEILSEQVLKKTKQASIEKFISKQRILLWPTVFTPLLILLMPLLFIDPMIFLVSTLLPFTLTFLSDLFLGYWLEFKGYLKSGGGKIINDLRNAYMSPVNEIEANGTDKLFHEIAKNPAKIKPVFLVEDFVHEENNTSYFRLLSGSTGKCLDKAEFQTHNLHQSYELVATWRAVQNDLNEEYATEIENFIQNKLASSHDLALSNKQTKESLRKEKQIAKQEQKAVKQLEMQKKQEIKEFSKRF